MRNKENTGDRSTKGVTTRSASKKAQRNPLAANNPPTDPPSKTVKGLFGVPEEDANQHPEAPPEDDSLQEFSFQTPGASSSSFPSTK